jgi:hypothetical protein
MKKTLQKLKRDAPLYLNGFFTGLLVFGREFGATEIVILVLCGITLAWAKNQKDETERNTRTTETS